MVLLTDEIGDPVPQKLRYNSDRQETATILVCFMAMMSNLQETDLP
jgi:hypothetical protein